MSVGVTPVDRRRFGRERGYTARMGGGLPDMTASPDTIGKVRSRLEVFSRLYKDPARDIFPMLGPFRTMEDVERVIEAATRGNQRAMEDLDRIAGALDRFLEGHREEILLAWRLRMYAQDAAILVDMIRRIKPGKFLVFSRDKRPESIGGVNLAFVSDSLPGLASTLQLDHPGSGEPDVSYLQGALRIRTLRDLAMFRDELLDFVLRNRNLLLAGGRKETTLGQDAHLWLCNQRDMLLRHHMNTDEYDNWIRRIVPGVWPPCSGLFYGGGRGGGRRKKKTGRSISRPVARFRPRKKPKKRIPVARKRRKTC